MINQNLASPHREQFFGQNLPMKRSIIVSDKQLFLDISKLSSSVHKNNQRTLSEVSKTPKSSTVITTIIFPSHGFLARKLKRIVESYLRTAFKKLQNHRKCRVNLDLLQNKAKRFVSSAFFSIKLFSQHHKGEKLVKFIEKNKKPDLIFSIIARNLKATYKETLERVRNFNKRNKNIEMFASLLDRIVKIQIKNFYKIALFRKMKCINGQFEQKNMGGSNICRLLSKIMKRVKIQSFRSIFSCLKKQQLEQANSLKKDFTLKMNQSSSERSKALNTHRQSIRNIKNNLDFFSADRSKTRYQIKRDITVNRSKLKQDEKKAKSTIGELEKQIKGIQNELTEIRSLNFKRLERLESPIDEKSVRDLYFILCKEQVNQLGEIQPKIFTKNKIVQLQTQVEKLDQYHIYMNQKLRQQVFEYEGITVYKSRWPEEQVVCEQNLTLKQLIRCITERLLDKTLFPYVFEEEVN